ncbi:MAG: chromate efflux transporter [bacterium]
MKDTQTAPVSLKDIARVFLKIGAIGFGGGVGMLGLIRQEVVERRGWIDDSKLAVAVAMGQVLPGPFVPNYAEFIGYQLRGLKGLMTAVFFLLLPGFVLMCVLGFVYFRYGTLPLVTRIFAGIQPVVVAILVWATWSISRANIKNWRQMVIGLIAATALFLKGDVLLVVLGCGVFGIFLSGAFRLRNQNTARALFLPLTLLSAFINHTPALPLVLHKVGELTLVFFKMGTVIFGGGFAAIPFLQHEVVEIRHWLTAKEFIDAVALGQMTPGPVAIMATFIGYRVLGLAGAVIATLGTFLPSTLMLLGLIHGYQRVKTSPLIQAFLFGVLPAVCGMLLVSTLFIARNAISGPLTALVTVVALLLLLRLRIEPVWLILAGAALGLVLF